MATIHSLFFGILLIAVCSPVGLGDSPVDVRDACCEVRGSDGRIRDSDAGAPVPGRTLARVFPRVSLTINTDAGLRWRATHVACLYPTRAPKHNTRTQIIAIARAELGVREATGHNDGKRVEEYLAYTNLGKGHAWCAAFVSWCYGQAGLTQPRNPWSPALFPNARTYWKNTDVGACLSGRQARVPSRASTDNSGNSQEFALIRIKKSDIFGIYSRTAKRINHVGLVKETQGKYLITIEGNSNNRVESRRRHLSTIYALADWM